MGVKLGATLSECVTHMCTSRTATSYDSKEYDIKIPGDALTNIIYGDLHPIFLGK